MNLILVNHHGRELNDANFEEQSPRICGMWKQLAQRYEYLNPQRYFFELRNEPDASISNANFHSLAQAIIDTVRRYDSQRTLIIGANWWNAAWSLAETTPYNDDNIIYTFHSYSPLRIYASGFFVDGFAARCKFSRHPR